MKITGVEVFQADAIWRNWVFLELSTDEGIVGVGEASLEGKEVIVETALHDLAEKYLVGRDPFDIEGHWLHMYRDEFYKGGPVLSTAISGLEMALWDIMGKALDQPVYNLLGGRCRNKIPAYANAWYIGERGPEQYAEKAKKVVAMGYKGLKFDPFGSAYRDMTREQELMAIALVEAVRDAVGPDVEIMVEVHGRLSVYTAIKIARELERFRPYWYEEPVDMENVAAMAQVARHCNIPIATGERLFTKYCFADLLDANAVQILQPDIVHVGGILEIKKVAAMADAKYIPVAPHNPNGPVAAAATLHVDAGTPNFLIQEAFDDFDPPWRNDLVINGPRVENGFYTFPTGPGLGLELNKDAIREHPPREKPYFSLWQESWEEGFAKGKKTT